MISNYYTLRRLVEEIRSSLEGAAVTRAFTRKKATLEIAFADMSGNQRELVFSCVPKENFFFLDDHYSTRSRGANVLPRIVNLKIDKVRISSNDRQLRIGLSDESSLVINFYGVSANVFHVDRDGNIIASFLKPSEHIGKKVLRGDGAFVFPENATELMKCLVSIDIDLARKLPKCLPTFDSVLAKEVVFRFEVGMNVEKGTDDSGESVVRTEELLYKIIEDMRRDLANPAPRIYLHDGTRTKFALIELRHLQSGECEMFASVNDAIKMFTQTREKLTQESETEHDIVAELKQRIASAKKTLSKIESDASLERVRKYRFAADYLMAHPESFVKGMDELIVNDGNEEVKVGVDASLTAFQNAQALYMKAKQVRTAATRNVARREDIVKKLERDEASLLRIESGEEARNTEPPRSRDVDSAGEQSRFRVFERHGFRIFVGKNAHNNDELTFGFAKPNDVFLHARGASGSHVIIRNPSREYPQKPIIMFAASIAAHYSKARSSSIVPVAFTMRKFVKKARGVPGAVILDREEVVFVKPEIPSS